MELLPSVIVVWAELRRPGKGEQHNCSAQGFQKLGSPWNKFGESFLTSYKQDGDEKKRPQMKMRPVLDEPFGAFLFTKKQLGHNIFSQNCDQAPLV
jgi:hypothetical protein